MAYNIFGTFDISYMPLTSHIHSFIHSFIHLFIHLDQKIMQQQKYIFSEGLSRLLEKLALIETGSL